LTYRGRLRSLALYLGAQGGDLGMKLLVVCTDLLILSSELLNIGLQLLIKLEDQLLRVGHDEKKINKD